MRKLIFALLLIACFNTGWSQDYDFLPEGLKYVSAQDLGASITINHETKAYLSNGEVIDIKEVNTYLTNASLKPLIFVNDEKVVKAIVFEKSGKVEKITRQEMEKARKGIQPGVSMANFTVTDLEGNEVSLENYKGKVVVLNFWFIACKPCVMEMPHLNKIVSKYKDEDVVFLAVTFDRKPDVEKFLKKKEFNYTIAADQMKLIGKMGIQSFPTNIILDQEGKVVLSHNGFSSMLMPEIDKTIGELIAEK